MPRPSRLQYPGEIYHVVNCGDGRRRVLFHDEGHYSRFIHGLSDEVDHIDFAGSEARQEIRSTREIGRKS
jgi:REP element-mobilizing transposase RayT